MSLWMALYVTSSPVKPTRPVGRRCNSTGSSLAHDMMNWSLNHNTFKKDAEALKFNCYSSYHSKRTNSVIDREQYAWNLEKKVFIFEIENVKYIMNALCSDIF